MSNIRPLCESLAKKAKEELHEDPNRIDEAIEILRTWISKQPHLKARTNDQFLVTFLRGTKYSLEIAKQKIDMFYTVRSAMPDFFKNRDVNDPATLEIIRLGIGLYLPISIAPDGPLIFLVRAGGYDAEKYHIRDILKVSTLVNDIAMIEDDNLAVAGQIGILDLANVTKAHFLQLEPSFIKKMTMLGQEASPLRQKGFHYVNTPPGFDFIFNIFKSFMNEKNKSRLCVHGDNMESLHKYVPQKLLPTEYGGEAGPLQDIIDMWEKKILSYREYFLDEDNYGINEKLRPGKPKRSEDLFGLEGTFRKLEFD